MLLRQKEIVAGSEEKLNVEKFKDLLGKIEDKAGKNKHQLEQFRHTHALVWLKEAAASLLTTEEHTAPPPLHLFLSGQTLLLAVSSCS